MSCLKAFDSDPDWFSGQISGIVFSRRLHPRDHLGHSHLSALGEDFPFYFSYYVNEFARQWCGCSLNKVYRYCFARKHPLMATLALWLTKTPQLCVGLHLRTKVTYAVDDAKKGLMPVLSWTDAVTTDEIRLLSARSDEGLAV